MYTEPYILALHPPRGLRRRATLRFAGATLVALAVGHGALQGRAGGHVWRRWRSEGIVGSVQIGLRDPQPPSRDVLEERLLFWSGVGSFAVPTLLLGMLVLDAAQKEEPLPGWFGPALAAWSGLASILMTKSPWPLAVASGLLISAAGESGRDGTGGPLQPNVAF